MFNPEALLAEVETERLTEMTQAVSYRNLGLRLGRFVPTIVRKVREPVSVEELRIIVNDIIEEEIPPQAFRDLASNVVTVYAKDDNRKQTLHVDRDPALLILALASTKQDILQAHPDIKHPQLDPDILDRDIQTLLSTNPYLLEAIPKIRAFIPLDDPLTLPEVVSGLCSVLVDRPDPNLRRYVFNIASHSYFGINIYVGGAIEPSVILNAQGALAFGVWVVTK